MIEARSDRGARRLTLALAAVAGAASAGLSASAGWFLASAALVGAMGPLAAHAFNFLAPSAAVRFFALMRTLARYGERVVGHDAVLAESARLRPRLFLALARDENRRDRLDAAGDIDARVMRDVETAEAALVQDQAPFWAALGAAAAAGLAAVFAGAAAALIVLAAFAATTWGASFAGSALARRAAKANVALRARLRALSASAETGVFELRTLHATGDMAALLQETGDRIASNEIALARVAALGNAVQGAIWTLALLLILATAQGAGGNWPGIIAAVLASLALSEQTALFIESRSRRAERAHAKARVAALLAKARPFPASAAPAPPGGLTN